MRQKGCKIGQSKVDRCIVTAVCGQLGQPQIQLAVAGVIGTIANDLPILAIDGTRLQSVVLVSTVRQAGLESGVDPFGDSLNVQMSTVGNSSNMMLVNCDELGGYGVIRADGKVRFRIHVD